MLKSKRDRKSQAWWSVRAHSGLGIDVGQAKTKLVWLDQVGPTLRACHTIVNTLNASEDCALETASEAKDRREDSNPFKSRSEDSGREGFHLTGDQLRGLCESIRKTIGKGRVSGCAMNLTLSMSACDYRSVYVPKDVVVNEQAIHHALCQAIGSPQRRCIAVLPNDESKPKCRVFSIEESLATSVGDTFEKHGFPPQRIDGLPWCLARAYQLLGQSAENVGLILDWSFGRPLLVSVLDQKLSYVRRLSSGGIQELCAQPMRDMGLSTLEASQWLKLCLASRTEEKSDASEDTRQWVRQSVVKMAEEINSAVEYIRWRAGKRPLTTIWTVGGAPRIDGLIEMLNADLSVPAQPWSLSTSNCTLTSELATATSLAMLGVKNG